MRSNDVVVIEGAGSPAEINLRGRDVANMYVAKLAKADCLLAVNIDWGGAFAYAVGTLMLLDEEERKLFKGVLINNMCSGGGSLGDSLEVVRRTTGVPVLACCRMCPPYICRWRIPWTSTNARRRWRNGGGSRPSSHDLQFHRFRRSLTGGRRQGHLRPGPGGAEPGRCGHPPGDQEHRSRSAMAAGKWDGPGHSGQGGGRPHPGICGGYQMLGRRILDEHGLEGSGPSEMEGRGCWTPSPISNHMIKGPCRCKVP